jgi:hypothetical protein
MARKIKVETDNSKWQAPKVRKKRKPMTEVQRVAATERLAAARDKKREENPEFGMSGIHESLRDLPKDHQLHPDKIKNWIKTQKDLLSSEKKGVRLNVKGAIARAADHDGYIRNMKSYLRNGDWTSDFYGEHQDKKIRWKCTALGYYWYGPKTGQAKRDVGVYYPDLGMVWEKDMENDC